MPRRNPVARPKAPPANQRRDFDEGSPGMLAVTALVDAGGTVTAVTDSGRNDRTCHAIAADMHVSMILGADAVATHTERVVLVRADSPYS